MCERDQGYKYALCVFLNYGKCFFLVHINPEIQRIPHPQCCFMSRGPCKCLLPAKTLCNLPHLCVCVSAFISGFLRSLEGLTKERGSEKCWCLCIRTLAVLWIPTLASRILVMFGDYGSPYSDSSVQFTVPVIQSERYSISQRATLRHLVTICNKNGLYGHACFYD